MLENHFVVSKQFLFKHTLISIQFLVLYSIIGASTSSASSSYFDEYRLQKLNDSLRYHKKDLEEIFYESYDHVKEDQIKSCNFFENS